MTFNIKEKLIPLKPIITEKIAIPKEVCSTKHKLLIEEKNNYQIAFFNNGLLYNVYPKDKNASIYDVWDVALTARYFVSNKQLYDLYDINDLILFNIPVLDNDPNNSILYLDTILAKRCKTLVSDDIAVPFIILTANIMLARGGGSKYELDRMIAQLFGLNLDKYALYLKREIYRRLPYMEDPLYLKKYTFNRVLMNCWKLRTDYIEAPYLATTCSECSRYQGRIYSISGDSRVFPKLPDRVLIYGAFHEGCIHNFYPAFYNETATMFKYITEEDGNIRTIKVNAIESSNRQFVDDRSNAEMERYNQLKMKLKKKHSELTIEDWKKQIQRSVEYAWIKENLPNMAPKSQSGYSNMKKRNQGII